MHLHVGILCSLKKYIMNMGIKKRNTKNCILFSLPLCLLLLLLLFQWLECIVCDACPFSLGGFTRDRSHIGCDPCSLSHGTPWGWHSFAAASTHTWLGWDLSCQFIPYPKSPKAKPGTLQSLFSPLPPDASLRTWSIIRVKALTPPTLPCLVYRCVHAIIIKVVLCIAGVVSKWLLFPGKHRAWPLMISAKEAVECGSLHEPVHVHPPVLGPWNADNGCCTMVHLVLLYLGACDVLLEFPAVCFVCMDGPQSLENWSKQECLMLNKNLVHRLYWECYTVSLQASDRDQNSLNRIDIV